MNRLNPFRDALPIVVGYIPAGMTFGLLARDIGLAIGDTLGFSGLVFAGASQYMAIDLIGSHTAALQIVFATFLLNFRHFLMSASLSRKLDESRGWVRAIVAYGVTDETFAVASSRKRFGARYLATVNLIAWSSWLSGSAIGYLAGSLLPESLGRAMGVALYALFASLLVPILRSSARFVVPAATAAALHTLLLELTPISHGWTFIIAVTVAALVGTMIPERRRVEQ